MNQNPWDLHEDRLATTDETGKRVFLFPADVQGKWRTRRTWVHSLLILLFIATPWMKWKGGPLILLDLSHRQFQFFDLSLRAHNAPLLFFLLAAVGFALFFFTSIFGRIWCGWACPQTVFIDTFFRRIDRWIEGPALKRKQLDSSPWNFEKVMKRSAKWTLFFLSSILITHSFLAYFVGGEKLLEMVTSHPRENWATFLFIFSLTAIILFDFGWFREQFCIIMCPYGRLQSVLMDENSSVVAYDSSRGELRGGAKDRKMNPDKPFGDCINCYRCVQVCPTGIDIRRGTQLECIACTACIDACDEVMEKVNKPKGLIRYTTENSLAKKKTQNIRARSVFYFIAMASASVALVFALRSVEPTEIRIFKAKSSPYTVQEVEGQNFVMNHLKVEVSDHDSEKKWIQVRSLDNAKLIMPIDPYPLEPLGLARIDIFVEVPLRQFKKGVYQTQIEFIINKDKKLIREVQLVGPMVESP